MFPWVISLFSCHAGHILWRRSSEERSWLISILKCIHVQWKLFILLNLPVSSNWIWTTWEGSKWLGGSAVSSRGREREKSVPRVWSSAKPAGERVHLLAPLWVLIKAWLLSSHCKQHYMWVAFGRPHKLIIDWLDWCGRERYEGSGGEAWKGSVERCLPAHGWLGREPEQFQSGQKKCKRAIKNVNFTE